MDVFCLVLVVLLQGKGRLNETANLWYLPNYLVAWGCQVFGGHLLPFRHSSGFDLSGYIVRHQCCERIKGTETL